MTKGVYEGVKHHPTPFRRSGETGQKDVRSGLDENQKVEFYVTEARRTQAVNVRPVA
jgi:hypothetical protein